jgi:hypothetical protein
LKITAWDVFYLQGAKYISLSDKIYLSPEGQE